MLLKIQILKYISILRFEFFTRLEFVHRTPLENFLEYFSVAPAFMPEIIWFDISHPRLLAVNAEGIDSQKAGELPLNSLFPDLPKGMPMAKGRGYGYLQGKYFMDTH